MTFGKQYLSMTRNLVIICCCLSMLNLPAQSPWLYKKKQGFYQIQTTFLAFPYTSLAVGRPTESTVDLNREVYTADILAYLEYGIANRWNIIGKIPFRYTSTGDETDQLYHPELLEEGSLTGLSNLEFAAKYQLMDQSWKMAASLRTILNTGSQDLEKGLTTGYDYTGMGLFGHVGRSVGKRSYVFTDLGFVVTTNDFSDYLQQHIEGGHRFGKAFWIRLTVDIKKSLKNGDYDNTTLLQTGLSPNDQEWIGFGAGIAYETRDKLGFNLSTGGAFVAEYVGLAAPITIGLYKKI